VASQPQLHSCNTVAATPQRSCHTVAYWPLLLLSHMSPTCHTVAATHGHAMSHCDLLATSGSEATVASHFARGRGTVTFLGQWLRRGQMKMVPPPPPSRAQLPFRTGSIFLETYSRIVNSNRQNASRSGSRYPPPLVGNILTGNQVPWCALVPY